MLKINKLIIVGVVLASFSASGFLAHAQQSDTIPPSTPSSISASVGQTYNQVIVSWSASTDNVGVVGYYLYRNGQEIANTPGVLTYTDTVQPGVYYYTVAAYDAAGNVSPQSSPSGNVSVVGDTVPPTMPTGLTVTLTTSSSITLSWNPSTDNIGVVGYYVYRNGQKILTSGPVTGTSYLDAGLSYGTYNYAVQAYDSAGNISQQSASESATLVLDESPPTVPMYLTAVATSSTEVDLSWRSSYDNVAVTGYNIYRNGTLIGTVGTTTTYADTSASGGTAYNYSVSAFDFSGNDSAQSVAAVVTTPAADTTPPTTPRDFDAVPLSSSQVDLSWNTSTDNVAVVGYYIYRNGAEIATVSATATTYMDTGLTTSTLYSYAIGAYDAAGNISQTATNVATTLAYTPATPVMPPAGGVTPPVYSTSTSPTGSTNPITPTNPGFVFSTSLRFGLRSTSVTNLQIFLISEGYLGAGYSTGYYGSLTQSGVQKFQCAQNIVCSGSPYTTGWGSVGPRTRAVLNLLY